MAVFFDGRCACSRELCDFTCSTYTAYMCQTQNNIGTWQERMKKEPITNAGRIRGMTDEELADLFCRIQYDVSDYYCGGHSCEPTLPTGKESWLNWMKQEVTDV